METNSVCTSIIFQMIDEIGATAYLVKSKHWVKYYRRDLWLKKDPFLVGTSVRVVSIVIPTNKWIGGLYENYKLKG